ncbi:hypothetical protein BsWGS_20543 [Bradybaena similaris]
MTDQLVNPSSRVSGRRP